MAELEQRIGVGRSFAALVDVEAREQHDRDDEDDAGSIETARVDGQTSRPTTVKWPQRRHQPYVPPSLSANTSRNMPDGDEQRAGDVDALRRRPRGASGA